ncbi:MAG: uracil phosphoribosyltransferase, partial [Flavobacteriales bacterium]|nr:uracil phosphoribosyltransferase [Flavobacteriales bacterium]
LASREGIDEIRSQLPPGVQIWAGAVDDTLTSKGYIVPGLGDAGDLAFGTKMT